MSGDFNFLKLTNHIPEPDAAEVKYLSCFKRHRDAYRRYIDGRHNECISAHVEVIDHKHAVIICQGKSFQHLKSNTH